MRVLVTGGAGYIGSHTLIELIFQGHDVMVLDNYCNALPEVLLRVSAVTDAQVPSVTGDIRDSSLLDQIMADFTPDAVIHFAGLKAVGESMEDPLKYYDVNVAGTVNLLAAMDRAGVTKLIFSSSATVYGEPAYQPYDELHPTAPTSTYGRTKLIVEEMLQDWSASQADVSAVVLRYFNPVGAHESAQLGEDPKGIPNNLMPFIAQVATGQRDALSIFGDDYETPDGTGYRDYIHVVDLARAHVAALGWAVNNKGVRAFNIGTGQAYSVHEMVKAFAAASQRNIPCNIMPRRAGDIASMQADVARAQSELCWQAVHDLDDMVSSTWAWQAANPNGYSSV